MWNALCIVILLSCTSNSASETDLWDIHTASATNFFVNSIATFSENVTTAFSKNDSAYFPGKDEPDIHANGTEKVYDDGIKDSSEKDLNSGENNGKEENKELNGDLSPNHRNDPLTGDRTWEEVMDMLQSETKSMIQTLKLTESLINANISNACRTSVERFLVSLSNWETWAILMADANRKLAGGILDGTATSFGSYDECIKIRVYSVDDDNVEDFRGRYCMVGYQSPPLSSILLQNGTINKNYVKYGESQEWMEYFLKKMGSFYLNKMAIWLGACVPSTCSETDVTKLFSHATKPFSLKVSTSNCQVDKPKVWTTNAIIALSVLCLLCAVCLIGTVADTVSRCIFKEQKALEYKCSFSHILKSFSLLSNTEKLFESGKADNKLSCLHGMRFVSATWVILSHTYTNRLSLDYWKYRRFLEVDNMIHSLIPPGIIDNAVHAVDTFFIFSGLLLVYSTWRKLEKSGGKMNIVMCMIHKYWRLTPSLGLTLAVFTVLSNIGSGPLWNNYFDKDMQICNSYWWTNLLYINNWLESENMCLPHTWFLPCLMQLHIIGILLLLLSFRWRILGVILGFAMVIGMCVLLALTPLWNNYPMPLSLSVADFNFKTVYFKTLYSKPHYHLNSYLIGMGIGFIILKYQEKKVKLGHQLICWILAIVGALYSIYGTYFATESTEAIVFYYSFQSLAWPLSIGWVTYACASGVGGTVNRFLSWKGFVPLDKLSYLAYLLHVLFINYKIGSMRERMHFTHTEMIPQLFINIIVGFFCAFIGYISVEMPFSFLERVLFKK